MLKNTLDLSDVNILELIKSGKHLQYITKAHPKTGIIFTISYGGKHHINGDYFIIHTSTSNVLEIIYDINVMILFNRHCTTDDTFQFID